MRLNLSRLLSEPKKYFAGMVGMFMIPIMILSALSGNSMAASRPRDCDSNAVIYCGAYSLSELRRKYTNQSGVNDIFSDFGITQYDMNHMHGHVRNGKVTKGGRVVVDGKTVARNAQTAGRQNMNGSTAYSSNGTTYYMRPPSVSFASSSLSAYVVMKNGTFDYAIIKSCGNPVIATPVVHVKKTKTIVAAPTVPTPTPPPPEQTQTQSQVQSQSVTVTYPPAKKTTEQRSESKTYTAPSETLPNTGPGDVAAIGVLTAIFSTLGHMRYQRRKLV